MNLHRPRTHLHYFRELIEMFQTLDREPSNQHDSAHRYTFVRNCSKTDLSFE